MTRADMPDKPRRPNYWEYIRVDELLALQGGLERDDAKISNDEVRFITIHQIDELWFKVALRELHAARDLFKQRRVPETKLAEARDALHRVALIFELAGQHFQLMETMRTQDYLSFRDKLSPASGFQSAQFREIEIMVGLDERERLAYGNEASYLDAMRTATGGTSPALDRVQRRLQDGPTLKDAIYTWLSRTPIQGSSPESAGDAGAVAEFVADFLACHQRAVETQIRELVHAQALTPADEERLRERYRREIDEARSHLQAQDEPDPGSRQRLQRIRAAILFIDTNRQLPLLSWPGEIIDALIELEQRMLIFRQRHARMVERVIGRRVGTGGSDGVAYLDQTALRYRVFKEVWIARTLMLRPDQAPPVKNADLYGLRGG